MQLLPQKSAKTKVRIHLAPNFKSSEIKPDQKDAKKSLKYQEFPRQPELRVTFFTISRWNYSQKRKESYLDWVYSGGFDGTNKKTVYYIMEKWKYHQHHYKENRKQLRLYEEMQYVGLGEGWQLRPVVSIIVKEKTSKKQIKKMKTMLLAYFHPSLQGYI